MSTDLVHEFDMDTIITSNIVLKAMWQINTYNVTFDKNGGSGSCPTQIIEHGFTAKKPSNPTKDGYTFKYWALAGQTSAYNFNTEVTNNLTLVAIWEKNCIAEGTLITLAGGTQKAVEDLNGTEQLLVWNMLTGQFDTAPILFIDSDARAKYEVIRLKFSDGTKVDIIDEHGFYNMTLNKYVFLDENASQYIGHMFNKQTIDENGNMVWKSVKLKKVKIINKKTTAYSPVTFSHLCYYVNGMLSMPGNTESLVNFFEVDSQTMKIDEAKMQADIETYGLFTYEEFYEIMPVSEQVFEAFNAKYFKIAIGKGILNINELENLFIEYSEFLN